MLELPQSFFISSCAYNNIPDHMVAEVC